MLSSLTFTFQGLHVLQSPRCTSVTRRAAGLPMLILCIVSAEETSKSRPLLAHSVHTLLETARTPLPQNWDQTLDLPQVCRHSNKNGHISSLKPQRQMWLHDCPFPSRCVQFTLCRPWCGVQVWEQPSFSLLLLLPSCHSLCSVLPAGPWGTLHCNFTVRHFIVYNMKDCIRTGA